MSYGIGHRPVFRVGENRENFRVKTLKEGEVQDYKVLKAAAKASGRPFVDPEFDCGQGDILGRWPRMPGGPYVWKRPHEIVEGAVFSEVDKFGERYSRSEIHQGGLGDCYYLTALGLILANKKLTDFVIPDDNNEDQELGIYHFRYWVKGYFFDVVVDDRLPCTDAGYVARYESGFVGQYKPVAALPAGKEFWPLLLEKAYAKLFGSYASIDAGGIGEAIEDFSGGVTEELLLKPGLIKDFKAITPPKYFGSFFGFGTPGVGRLGLEPGHAYAVIDQVDVTDIHGNAIRLLKLRNPWGKGEWHGDWADIPRSSKWDTLPPADADRLFTQKDEGEFYMSVEDATNPQNFYTIFTGYWLNDLDTDLDMENAPWKYIEKHEEWKGGSAQPLTGYSKDYANKPQYVVKFDKEGENPQNILVCSLQYKDYLERPLTDDDITLFKIFKINDEELLKQGPPFPGYAFGRESGSKLEECEIDVMKVRAKRQELCSGRTLPNGSYVVIPYIQSERVVEGRYLFRLIVDGKNGVTAASTQPQSDAPEKVNVPDPRNDIQGILKKLGINATRVDGPTPQQPANNASQPGFMAGIQGLDGFQNFNYRPNPPPANRFQFQIQPQQNWQNGWTNQLPQYNNFNGGLGPASFYNFF